MKTRKLKKRPLLQKKSLTYLYVFLIIFLTLYVGYVIAHNRQTKRTRAQAPAACAGADLTHCRPPILTPPCGSTEIVPAVPPCQCPVSFPNYCQRDPNAPTPTPAAATPTSTSGVINCPENCKEWENYRTDAKKFNQVIDSDGNKYLRDSWINVFDPNHSNQFFHYSKLNGCGEKKTVFDATTGISKGVNPQPFPIFSGKGCKQNENLADRIIDWVQDQSRMFEDVMSYGVCCLDVNDPKYKNVAVDPSLLLITSCAVCKTAGDSCSIPAVLAPAPIACITPGQNYCCVLKSALTPSPRSTTPIPTTTPRPTSTPRPTPTTTCPVPDFYCGHRLFSHSFDPVIYPEDVACPTPNTVPWQWPAIPCTYLAGDLRLMRTGFCCGSVSRIPPPTLTPLPGPNECDVSCSSKSRYCPPCGCGKVDLGKLECSTQNKYCCVTPTPGGDCEAAGGVCYDLHRGLWGVFSPIESAKTWLGCTYAGDIPNVHRKVYGSDNCRSGSVCCYPK